MKRSLAHFLRSEDGAVSIDFVVLTAAIAIMALGAISVIVSEGAMYGEVIADLIATALRS
ncbi:MAG: hypothetical protein JNN06_09040 [Gemmobacter sp.]|uniref:hypothetical protein n=1 Tax=Gemmobacter sp. TaxID=1898957 RepID=UPI001A457E4D|nr:hypothetical protein [Gemmobacter sp.]MBL8562413.1 hypothetical protein [Gemmobacter sp.]